MTDALYAANLAANWFERSLVELEPNKLTAAQQPIIVQTHLHLITCPPDLETKLFLYPPHPTVHIISRGFTIPTPPPTCQMILNATKPRPFTHLAVKLQGSSSICHVLSL